MMQVRCDAVDCVATATAQTVDMGAFAFYDVPDSWQDKRGEHLCPIHKEKE